MSVRIIESHRKLSTFPSQWGQLLLPPTAAELPSPPPDFCAPDFLTEVIFWTNFTNIFSRLWFQSSDQMIAQAACQQASWLRSNQDPNIQSDREASPPIRRQISNLNSCCQAITCTRNIHFQENLAFLISVWYKSYFIVSHICQKAHLMCLHTDVNMERDYRWIIGFTNSNLRLLILPVPICFPDHPAASQVPAQEPSLSGIIHVFQKSKNWVRYIVE